MRNPELDLLNKIYDALVDPSSSSTTTTTQKLGTTSTQSSVTSNASTVTLLAANTSRIKAIIRNDGTGVLYVREGAGAAITDVIRLAQNDTIIITDSSEIITGIWTSPNGSARISETV